MKLLRYILLILLLCNVPSIVLIGYGSPTLGSLFSYLTLILLLLYYFLTKKHRPVWPFIIFGMLYFSIAGVIYVDIAKDYFTDFIRYMILLLCGGELARKTTEKELFPILLIGASSILANAAFFPDDFGRYSGFYLDANSAGFLCLLGCALSFSIKKEKIKLLVLFFFTFCGVLTFSRTFFLLWALLILISSFQNIKNSKIFALGIGALILIVSVGSLLQVNTKRLSFVDSLISGGTVSKSVEEDSRTETWAEYYDRIYEAPILGHGYKIFSTNQYENGVHNNYLRIIGEAGILPFLLYIGIYVYIFMKSIKYFRTKPHYILLAISLIFLQLTNHNFDTITHVVFLSLWLYFRVTTNMDEPTSQETGLQNEQVTEHINFIRPSNGQ